MTLSGALLLVMAVASAPPPELQVCLTRLPLDPCGDGAWKLAALVRVWNAGGTASLSWSVDGSVRDTVSAELVDGEVSRNLLIFEPSATSHVVSLEARLGDLTARDEQRVGLVACPSALAVETVEVVPGRRVLVAVVNHGPGASGAWGIRAEVGGALVYESVVDSLRPGGRYALQVGWDDVLDRAGPGKALIPFIVRLNPGPGDLLAGEKPYRVLLPRE